MDSGMILDQLPLLNADPGCIRDNDHEVVFVAGEAGEWKSCPAA